MLLEHLREKSEEEFANHIFLLSQRKKIRSHIRIKVDIVDMNFDAELRLNYDLWESHINIIGSFGLSKLEFRSNFKDRLSL